MKKKLIEHSVSVFFITAIFSALILFIQKGEMSGVPNVDARVREYVQLGFIDFGDPLDKALFKESLDMFYPDSLDGNAALVQAIDDYRREQFANELYKTGAEERGLTWSKVSVLLVMYLQFIIIYLVVMALTYYGAQTLGILRFIRMKQNRSSYLVEFFSHVTLSQKAPASQAGYRFFLHAGVLLLKAFAKGVAYAVLFSPAYVIAYSFKTEFATDSYVFMILLGVVSNGLLVNYANRFYTILVSESRRGYVETAMVKNLNSSYFLHSPEGISMKSVLRLRKHFPSHVFQHIYLNAHYQFQPTLKEHASFLITGLVIIEMALNIQGHLSYEMLKNILSKQYDVVLCIVLGIFLLVKATEIAVDLWSERGLKHYENRAG